MASSTCARILSLTPYAFRITLDTAARETPASRATSWIVEGRELASDACADADRDADADTGDNGPSGWGSAEVTAVFPIL
jgi:hypothetical protein